MTVNCLFTPNTEFSLSPLQRVLAELAHHLQTIPLLYNGRCPSHWYLGLKRFAGLLSVLNQGIATVQPLSHSLAPSRKEAKLHLEVLRFES